jgi:hypothetical protein
MKKHEWLTATVVAFAVAMAMATYIAPPALWADQASLAVIPALPPSYLTIPSIAAKVTAATAPDPGNPVAVTLTVTAPSGSEVRQVPVTVTVLRRTMNPMARVMPPAQQVAQVSATVTLSPEGTGTALVDLPFTWEATPTAKSTDTSGDTSQTAPPPEWMKAVTKYSMTLSSTLNEQASPTTIDTLNDRADNTSGIVPIFRVSGDTPPVSVAPQQPNGAAQE